MYMTIVCMYIIDDNQVKLRYGTEQSIPYIISSYSAPCRALVIGYPEGVCAEGMINHRSIYCRLVIIGRTKIGALVYREFQYYSFSETKKLFNRTWTSSWMRSQPLFGLVYSFFVSCFAIYLEATAGYALFLVYIPTKDLSSDDTILLVMLSFRACGEPIPKRSASKIDGTGTTKPCYNKIQFCGEQTGRDDLQYFWIDTCELQKAINFMFHWYRNAMRTYLADVSRPAFGKPSQLPWESSFRKSGWFTSGPFRSLSSGIRGILLY